MITVEQFMKLSPRDSLWRVMVVNPIRGPYVIKSQLNDARSAMKARSHVVSRHPEHFFLDKEEAEEYAEVLTILLRLQR